MKKKKIKFLFLFILNIDFFFLLGFIFGVIFFLAIT